MTVPLLTTKLYIPTVRPDLVRRPRLIERLNAGVQLGSRLTLVSAPAGFGKTTLIAEWLSDVDCPHTWLSLDASDSDPARFLTYLVAALRKIDAAIGQAAQGMLHEPQMPPAEALMVSLINDMAAASSPLILVLDDYHLIHTLSIHEQIAFLLDHQPPQAHLVILSRDDPPLPLSRLRARGQVTDIRQDDLKFTEAEAAHFVRWTMALDLSTADVAALYRRTEGWIAGLQLAATSLRGRDNVQQLVQSFTGSNRYILDYLIEEVFRQQPADVQRFLLQTSVLERFTSALCDAVAEREDSREVLLALEHANLFLVPLDESRQWYRYHHLFADLLRHRLQIDMGEQNAPLHQRASRWYAAHGLPDEAIRHALTAGDWEVAADLIVQVNTDMLKQGQVVTLLSWFRALPDAFIRSRPGLCYEYVWPLILSEEIDVAESYLAHVEKSVEQDPAFPGKVAAAQAYIALIRGQGRRALELSQQALAQLPQDDFASRSVMAMNLGRAYWYAGRLVQAEQVLVEAEQSAQRSGNDYARLTAGIIWSKIQAARGRLEQAAASYRRIIEQGGRIPVVAIAHADLAKLLYEQNDLEAAAEHVQQGLDLSRQTGNVEFQIANLRTLSLVWQAQGDTAAAEKALEEDMQLIQHPGVSLFARLHALAYHALAALNGADLQTASYLLEQSQPLAEAGSLPDYVLLSLAQARLLLAQGQREAIARLLAARDARVEQAGFQSAIIETRALQALTASTSEEAFACLEQALTLAEPGGFVRTFVDLGEAMKTLFLAFLTQRSANSGIQAYVQRLLAAFSPPEAHPLIGGSAAVERPHPTLIEPLSERELDVLRLLTEGRTNHEIARDLHLSINTIKTHLSTIYGKLGVHGRRQATARGKELGFLE